MKRKQCSKQYLHYSQKDCIIKKVKELFNTHIDIEKTQQKYFFNTESDLHVIFRLTSACFWVIAIFMNDLKSSNVLIKYFIAECVNDERSGIQVGGGGLPGRKGSSTHNIPDALFRGSEKPFDDDLNKFMEIFIKYLQSYMRKQYFGPGRHESVRNRTGTSFYMIKCLGGSTGETARDWGWWFTGIWRFLED